ncbi:MAG TPA: hypothetical protein VIQ53_15560, partial [Inquilinus sp.]
GRRVEHVAGAAAAAGRGLAVDEVMDRIHAALLQNFLSPTGSETVRFAASLATGLAAGAPLS